MTDIAALLDQAVFEAKSTAPADVPADEIDPAIAAFVDNVIAKDQAAFIPVTGVEQRDYFRAQIMAAARLKGMTAMVKDRFDDKDDKDKLTRIRVTVGKKRGRAAADESADVSPADEGENETADVTSETSGKKGNK